MKKILILSLIFIIVSYSFAQKNKYNFELIDSMIISQNIISGKELSVNRLLFKCYEKDTIYFYQPQLRLCKGEVPKFFNVLSLSKDGKYVDNRKFEYDSHENSEKNKKNFMVEADSSDIHYSRSTFSVFKTGNFLYVFEGGQFISVDRIRIKKYDLNGKLIKISYISEAKNKFVETNFIQNISQYILNYNNNSYIILPINKKSKGIGLGLFDINDGKLFNFISAQNIRAYVADNLNKKIIISWEDKNFLSEYDLNGNLVRNFGNDQTICWLKPDKKNAKKEPVKVTYYNKKNNLETKTYYRYSYSNNCDKWYYNERGSFYIDSINNLLIHNYYCCDNSNDIRRLTKSYLRFYNLKTKEFLYETKSNIKLEDILYQDGDKFIIKKSSIIGKDLNDLTFYKYKLLK